MKISKLLFVSRANLKGAKRKKSVLVMMILAVVAVTVLAGFLSVVNNNVQQNKNRLEMRQILVLPEAVYPETSNKGINEKTIDEVLGLDHVLSCEAQPYADQVIEVTKIADSDGNDVTNSTDGLYPEKLGISIQKADVEFSYASLNGEQLKDSPVMSCIIPDKGYNWNNDTRSYEETSTTELLGKTITLDYKYYMKLYRKSNSDDIQTGGYVPEISDLQYANIEYDLKVVGVYHYTTGALAILISDETARQIENMAINNAVKSDALDAYINDPYAREYIVTVDHQENAAEVEAKMTELGYAAGIIGMLNPALESFSSVFNVAGTILLVAIILLTVINLFLSVYSNINERRAEIGLMKAVGYKSSQIFKSMYFENVILALKAIIVGGIISVVGVFVINLINKSSGDLMRMRLIMPWSQFGILLLVAFAIILIIPLICQLIMTALITRVQPQEAMNS